MKTMTGMMIKMMIMVPPLHIIILETAWIFNAALYY